MTRQKNIEDGSSMPASGTNAPFTYVPDRYSYFPGQIGIGKVKIREKAKINGIDLCLMRKSNRLKEKEVARFSVSKDSLSADAVDFTIPFEIPRIIPSSFKGKKLKVWYEWLVVVDIPWARDSMLRVPMKIIPMPLVNKSLSMFIKTSPLPQKKRGLFANRRNKIIFFISGFMFMAIPFVVVPVFFLIRKILLWRIVRDYRILVPRKEWAMGETLPVEVKLRANKEIHLNKIDITLEATESFWKSGGGKSKWKFFTAFQQSVRPCNGWSLNASDGYVDFKGELKIPSDLPSLEKNMVWQLSVHLDIDACPDIKWSEEILVLPMLVGAVAGNPPRKNAPKKK